MENIPSPDKLLAKRHLVIFRIVSVLLPFLLLGMLEIVLRFAGYGHDLTLFVESKDHKGYLVMNPHASEKYFGETENATVGNYEEFSKIKPKGTFRIFVLGESTTVGYPYFYNASFHRWLQYRLMHTYQDKKFEIINVALTAVNSYTVLGFGKEVLKYEPDAIMIYTGHNEYYGAMGAGSTNTINGNRFLINTILQLREFRIVQLFNRSLLKIKMILSDKDKVDREGLMKRMAADQQIAFGSELYKQGIKQFETNMDELLAIINKEKVPVFISNLVSNEKDLKPFISEGNESGSALIVYKKGQEALKEQHFALSKELFIKAKELDLLRFRAPQAMNDIISKLVKKYSYSHLIDTKSIFEKNSTNGILGHETLLEHVHPNLFGYALMSDAFYKVFTNTFKWPNENEISFAQLCEKMPVTKVDSLRGTYEVMLLKESWPFNEIIPESEKQLKTFEASLAMKLVLKQATWGDAMTVLMDHYQKQNDIPSAMKVCEALTLEHPYEPLLFLQVGRLSSQIGEIENAVFYLKQGFTLEASFEMARELFINLLKADRSEEAIVYLRYAAEHNNTTFSLNELISYVEQINVLKAKYKKEPANTALPINIANTYLQFANVDVADRYAQIALRTEPNNLSALDVKRKIIEIKKQISVNN